MRKKNLFIAILMILSIGQACLGLVFFEIGPVNTDERDTIPEHESRVLYSSGFGSDDYFFNSNIEEINEIINMFSKMRIRDHKLTINSGKRHYKHLENTIEYNVMFRQYGFDIPEYNLFIFTDDYQTLSKQLEIPDNIFLVSDINDFPLKSKAVIPERKTWYGKIQFNDSIEYDSTLVSWTMQVTLWEKDIEGGIIIAKVKDQGIISMEFSEDEIAALKAGNSWLTLNAGNSIVNAKQTDTRLPFDFLSQDIENTKTIAVDGPKCYYGRLLFDDGSPTIMDPEPWPGAQIDIEFSYAGAFEIDSEGYFKVYFSKELYEEIKSEKVRKNIYVPDYENKGRSTAIFTYPVSELSMDKSKAGVVTIPRPVPPKQELSIVESKVGKQIPGFEKIKSTDFQPEQANGKLLLVCFWDIEQRPSRQFILELEKQKETLQNKNIEILIVHAGTKAETEVNNWIQENNISFASGIVDGDPYNTLWVWGARGLPWLVLTDDKHVIAKAGFNIDELLAD
ncbi:MAG: redoxin domain-containing protein [Sedimentisphaerales bacterium]|nr:redoxin domain-containing protein [Sedimentisphaerales bacterium]